MGETTKRGRKWAIAIVFFVLAASIFAAYQYSRLLDQPHSFLGVEDSAPLTGCQQCLQFANAVKKATVVDLTKGAKFDCMFIQDLFRWTCDGFMNSSLSICDELILQKRDECTKEALDIYLSVKKEIDSGKTPEQVCSARGDCTNTTTIQERQRTQNNVQSLLSYIPQEMLQTVQEPIKKGNDTPFSSYECNECMTLGYMSELTEEQMQQMFPQAFAIFTQILTRQCEVEFPESFSSICTTLLDGFEDKGFNGVKTLFSFIRNSTSGGSTYMSFCQSRHDCSKEDGAYVNWRPEGTKNRWMN